MADKMTKEEFEAKYGSDSQYIEKESQTQTSKCPNCGAIMVYNPDTKSLQCPYCESEKDIDFKGYSEEIDFEKIFHVNNNSWGNETHVIRCNNCGATTIISKQDISRICPYCGTTNVVETEEIPGLKPNGVVPFSFGNDGASNYVKEWGHKKWLSPRDFRKSLEPEEIKGIYFPVFTFDSDTFSNYSGRLGKRYTKHVRRNGKDYTVTETRYFTVSGNLSHFFNDIMIQASNRLDKKVLYKLGQFDTNHSIDYTQDYLFGFTAEGATRSGVECYQDAKKIMDQEIRRMILKKYDYDVVDYLNVKTNHRDQTFKYILVPLYVGHNLYRGKNYNFYVNGLTGKVAGKSPKSVIKVSLLVLGILIIIGLIAFLGIYYFE